MAEKQDETVIRQLLVDLLDKTDDWSDPWLYRIMELGGIALQPSHGDIQLNRDLKEIGGLCLYAVEKFKPQLRKGTSEETKQEALTLLGECHDIYAYHRGQSDLLELLVVMELEVEKLEGIAKQLDDLNRRRFKDLTAKCCKFLLTMYGQQFTRRGRPRKRIRDPIKERDKEIYNEAFFRTVPSEPIRTGQDLKSWANEADRILPKIVKERLNDLPLLGGTDEDKAKAHTKRIRHRMQSLMDQISDGPLEGEK